MLNPWTLHIVVAVADAGSFSAAGEELAMTQPAVSRQIAGLERQLGVKLFRRLPRGVTPTPAGDAAVAHARSILAQLRSMEAMVRAYGGDDAGGLRLGGFPSANAFLVPEAIFRLQASRPGVDVSLSPVDPFDAVDAVRRGDLDLGLVTSWQLYAQPEVARVDPDAARPIATDGVDLVHLADEGLVLALPPSHPLADEATVRLRALRDETWIEGAYPDCLGPIQRLAEALGGPPRVDFICHDWTGKQALVARGAGVMLVPELAVGSIRSGVELRPTRPKLPPRALFAVVPKAPYRPPVIDEMVSVLASVVATAREP
jgi:DNA-binding transcriptional LysR family regulator